MASSDHGNKPPPLAPSSPAGAAPRPPHPEQVVKCPRCDSPNTKFCYYNNYSLTQPRHFCKTCRRYWTKGGALRNVPIGGGCRKSKKLKSSTSSTSSSSTSTNATSSADIGSGGFKFFNSPPPMDFNLKDLSLMPSPQSTAGMINYSLHSQFSFDGSVAPPPPPPPLGFSLEPTMMMMMRGGAGGSNGGSMNVNTSLATSIESLSCMNQDLHWKLQQQRLALLFGDNNNNNNNNKDGGPTGMPRQHGEDEREEEELAEDQKPQPILFRDLGAGESTHHHKQQAVVKADGEAATEWFFGNSYGQVVGSGGGSGAAAGSAPSNWNGGGGGGNGHVGVQAWGDLNPYTTSLP